MHGAAYKAEDIKRYLRGEMPAAEMHALENAALDDPFLADAIEGMEKKPGFEADVTELRKRLNNRRGQKNAAIYWKAAAVLIVVITAVALVLLTDSQKVQKQEAVLAKVEERKDTQATFTPQEKDEESMETVTVPSPTAKTETKDRYKEEEKKQAPVSIEREDRAANITLAEKTTSVADSISPSMPLNDTAPAQELEGRTAGIHIDANAKLDEVVVVGYSAKKKNTKRFSGFSVEARNQKAVIPAGGWRAFDDYLYDNKLITGSDSLKEGIEVVSFTIGATGRPRDIKIKKSISPAHDAEVIRLLENGPDWQVIKGKNKRVRLEIIF